MEWPPSLSGAIEKAPTVPFCELLRNSAQYDKMIVRTQATFFRNMENQTLEASGCVSENPYVWVEFDPAYVYTEEAIKSKFQQSLCPSQPCPTGTARVTVVGRFDGPEDGPYGHLDGYRLRFSVIRLETVEPIGSIWANREGLPRPEVGLSINQRSRSMKDVKK